VVSRYLEWWNIKEPVFVAGESSRGALLPSRVELVERLAAHATRGGGVALVTGVAGMGRTTLMRQLYETLPLENTDCWALTILGPTHGAEWFLAQLDVFLGLGAGATDDERLRRLALRLAGGRHLVILLDHAHMLADMSALEAINVLLDADAGSVALVMAGDASLRRVLPASLAHRLACEIRLEPVPEGELSAFAQERLSRAGLGKAFSSAALEVVVEASLGVPRRFVTLAEGCLVEAAVRRARTIDEPIARGVPVSEDEGKNLEGGEVSEERPLARRVSDLFALWERQEKGLPEE
jgi:type II secretory pathway predicted ATPase ExeA